MKKLLAVLTIVCALLVAYTVAPSNVEASSKRTVYKVAVNSLEVKAAASTTSKRVVTLKKNAFVTVLSTSKGWSRVLINGKRGYVKTGQIAKAKASSATVSAKSGIKIYTTPSTKSKVYSTVKYNGKVSSYGKFDSTFSYVQVGNVTGYALTKSLKAAASTTVKTVSFYQGLVPIGIKNRTFNYYLASSQGYGGHIFNKFTYSGSKAKGTFSVKMTHKEDEYALDKYSETKKGFTFAPAYNRAEIKIDYPAKKGNKKTYTTKVREYDDNGEYEDVSIKVTTTVKAVKSNFTTRYGEVMKNVVAIQITGPDNFDAVYVFNLNKGLIYSELEEGSGDYAHGEILTLSEGDDY